MKEKYAIVWPTSIILNKKKLTQLKHKGRHSPEQDNYNNCTLSMHYTTQTYIITGKRAIIISVSEPDDHSTTNEWVGWMDGTSNGVSLQNDAPFI